MRPPMAPGLLRPALTLCRRPAKRARYSSSLAGQVPSYDVLLFGGDQFSVQTMESLRSLDSNNVIRSLKVVTVEDRFTGKKLGIRHRPLLRSIAEKLGVKVTTVPPGFEDWELKAAQTTPRSILLTASFPLLIPSRIIRAVPPLQALNLHPSLLPKYRGAAPIQWAIARGEKTTGITLQTLSEEKFDRGLILDQEEVGISPDTYYKSLEYATATLGASMFLRVLDDLPGYQARARPQSSKLVPLSWVAPKISRATARIDWANQTASEIERSGRAWGHQYEPWTTFVTNESPPLESSKRVKVKPEDTQVELHDISVYTGERPWADHPEPGRVHCDTQGKYVKDGWALFVACKDGTVLQVNSLKPSDKKPRKAREWINGFYSKRRKGDPLVEVRFVSEGDKTTVQKKA